MENITVNESYFAQLGDMYLEHFYRASEKVQFSMERNDATTDLTLNDIAVLRRMVPGLQIYKVTKTVEEIEQVFEDVVF